jgi:hypothetical protein
MTDASDIVARLRYIAFTGERTDYDAMRIMREAADEIERLRIYLNLAKQLADAVERTWEAASPQPMTSFIDAHSKYVDAAAHERNAVLAFRDAAKEEGDGWPLKEPGSEAGTQ